MIAALILAIASPLLTANDYDFVAVRCPHLIRGVIMGETNGYSAVRYEDIEFLEEARRERASLIRGDSCAKATNTHLRADLILSATSLAPVDALDWIVATNAVSSGARLVATGNKTHRKWTVERTPYTYERYVTQVLTNGVTDVWTNRYTAISNVVKTAIVTNAITEADFCMATVAQVPDETDFQRDRVTMGLSSEIVSGKTVADAYRHYKGIWRAAPYATTLVATSNVVYTRTYTYYKSGGTVYTDETVETRVEDWTHAPGYQVSGRWTVGSYSETKEYSETFAQAAVYMMRSKVPTNLVGRVSSAKAFVGFGNGSARAVVPIGTVTATVVAGEPNVVFVTQPVNDKTLLVTAARAVGWTVRDYGDVAQGERYAQSLTSATLYLQIDFNPKTTW